MTVLVYLEQPTEPSTSRPSRPPPWRRPSPAVRRRTRSWQVHAGHSRWTGRRRWTPCMSRCTTRSARTRRARSPRRSSSWPGASARRPSSGPGTERGNEVLAHVAALLDLPLAANCVSVAGADVTRVRWGGSLLEEARVDAPTLLLTVQPHAVAAEAGGGRRRRASRRSRRRSPTAALAATRRGAGGRVDGRGLARRRQGRRIRRARRRLGGRVRTDRGARGAARAPRSAARAP